MSRNDYGQRFGEPKQYFGKFPDGRKAMKRGGDVMPKRNKKNYRPTEKAAGMTRARLKRAFDMAKKMKPTGRINAADIRRVAMMLAQGKKPVLDSKGKPVKNLFQKSKGRQVPITGVKGMRKPYAGKALKRAAKKMKKMI